MNEDTNGREVDGGGNDSGVAGENQQLLSRALAGTLENLNVSIERMEAIVRKFENGEADLDESISLLSEANELAVSSSKELDRAVQKVVYQGDEAVTGEGSGNRDEDEEAQGS